MANTKTLTAANAVILVSVANLFPVPVQLQGFSADDVTDTEALETVETMMGVDGFLSGGFIFAPVRQNYSLQADSDSIAFFEAWYAAMQQSRETFIASGSLTVSSLQRRYTMSRGFLRSYVPTPSLKRVAQPRRFAIEWGRISGSPV